jgi:hypothetical protein
MPPISAEDERALMELDADNDDHRRFRRYMFSALLTMSHGEGCPCEHILFANVLFPLILRPVSFEDLVTSFTTRQLSFIMSVVEDADSAEAEQVLRAVCLVKGIAYEKSRDL